MKKTSITLALLFALAGSSCANAAAPEFIRTASTPAFETDFTEAAEKTVNAVVCIKSFASRQQNPYGNQGGYDPFGMFDFFFGNPGGGQRQQPRQQQIPGGLRRKVQCGLQTLGGPGTDGVT